MLETLRRRIVYIPFGIHLLALVAGTAVAFFLKHTSGNENSHVLLLFPLTISWWTTLLAVSLNTCVAMAQTYRNPERLSASTVHPCKAVWSWFLEGGTVAFVFICTAIPFLSLSVFFAGIQWDVLVFTPLYWFLRFLTFNAILIAVLAGVKSKSEWPLRLVLLALLGWDMLHWFQYGIPETYELEHFSPTTWWSDFYQLIFREYYVHAYFPLLMLFVAVLLLKPDASNRTSLLKLFATSSLFIGAVILAMAVVCAKASMLDSSKNQVFWSGWTSMIKWTVTAFCIIALYEGDSKPSITQNFSCKSKLGKFFLFPFCSGDCNTFIWIGIWLLPTLLLVKTCPSRGPYGYLVQFYTELEFGWILWVFNYTLTTSLLWNLILYRFVSKKWIGVVMAGLLAMGVAASLSLYGSFSADWRNNLVLVPNPLWTPCAWNGIDLFEPGSKYVQIGVYWFFAILPLLFVWYVVRLKKILSSDPQAPGTENDNNGR